MNIKEELTRLERMTTGELGRSDGTQLRTL
jgi:hypothetical protein